MLSSHCSSAVLLKTVAENEFLSIWCFLRKSDTITLLICMRLVVLLSLKIHIYIFIILYDFNKVARKKARLIARDYSTVSRLIFVKHALTMCKYFCKHFYILSFIALKYKTYLCLIITVTSNILFSYSYVIQQKNSKLLK